MGWEVRKSASRTCHDGVSHSYVLHGSFTETHELESTGEHGGDEDVGEGDAVSNEEGLGGKLVLEVGSAGGDLDLGGVDVGLVVGDSPSEGSEPSSESGEEVGVGP